LEGLEGGVRTASVDLDERDPSSCIFPSSVHLRELGFSSLSQSQFPSSSHGKVQVVHKGRRLQSLEGLGHGEVVRVRVCGLRGGGADGGSTGAEDRKAWLEMFLEQKPDKVDPREVKKAKWTRCQLSGEELSPPCVADCLGNLYNKEAVVSRLLSKSMPSGCSHIKNLQSVTDLKLERNEESPAGGSRDFQFQCPVTGLEMNGRFRFYCVRPSGLVVSQRAVREAKECVEELSGGTVEGNLLPLNGTEDEVRALRDKWEKDQQAKKKKKKKKRARQGDGKDKQDGKKRKEGKKEFTATDVMPEGANKEVYASIFTSSRKEETKETFLCRSTSARGSALT